MSDVAIRVEGLSKRYRIGALRVRHDTLRDLIASKFKGRTGDGQKAAASNPDDTIWALKDVSFEVKRGEVIGIIGRNGAGKSTLLKILSRITEPTEGSADIYGRVASLLEVGTGFHPELTGRENIFLNGAILGMRKAEIVKRFDEIVAFAEVEKFIDTPVKHYSSGMHVRLAFAVAAHLEPEILMVDEVLAVGDADFQKKCIGSMKSVASSGRTVLVVSHNIGLIESLCRNTLWLKDGQMETNGPSQEVIAKYLRRSESGTHSTLLGGESRRNVSARFTSIEILDDLGNKTHDIPVGKGMVFKLGIVAQEPIRQPWIGIQVRTQFNQLISHIANREAGHELQPLEGDCAVTCEIQTMNLLPGRYFVDLILADMLNRVYDQVDQAAFFDLHERDVMGSGLPLGSSHGLVFFLSKWKVEPE